MSTSSTNARARRGILAIGVAVTFHLDESIAELRGWAEAVVEKDLDRALGDAGIRDVSIESVTTRFEEAS